MSLTTVSPELQAAIYQRLIGDTTLMGRAMVPGETLSIQDNVRPNNPFPYVVIGEFTEVNASTFNKDGRQVAANLHIYSRYLGWKEAQTILKDLIRLLDKNHGPSGLIDSGTGIYVAMARYDSSVGNAESSDLGYIVRHIAAKFNFTVMET